MKRCSLCFCRDESLFYDGDGYCISCRKKENQRYYLINKQKIDTRHKKNARRYRKITASQHRLRYATDNSYRLKKILSGRIYKAISRGHKSASSVKLLGCSIPQLQVHLESQFQPGMSWDNYGDWHIDHRLPCASFDLSNPDEQRVCFHHSNLQPLWAADNLSKGPR